MAYFETLLFGIVYYFGMQFIGGTLGISAGLLYALFDYVNRIYEPIQTFMNVVSGFQQSLAAGDQACLNDGYAKRGIGRALRI